MADTKIANNNILSGIGGWFKNTFNAKYWDSMKFALYCLTHPLDGFWDLTHEKRGTYAAANTILFLTCFVRVISLKYTSFLFIRVYWEELNIFLYIASIVFPLGLFVIGNWATTTLFDGKGRLGQVYIGVCYGLTPYPLVQVPLMFLSNVVTNDEAEFYTVISVLSLVWCGLLIIAGMGQIHEFSGGKNILFMIFSLFAVLVMIFLLLLFFSMITQGIGYFYSLYREFMFRM